MSGPDVNSIRCASCGTFIQVPGTDWVEAAIGHLALCERRDDRIFVPAWTITPIGPIDQAQHAVEIAWTGTRSTTWNRFLCEVPDVL